MALNFHHMLGSGPSTHGAEASGLFFSGLLAFHNREMKPQIPMLIPPPPHMMAISLGSLDGERTRISHPQNARDSVPLLPSRRAGNSEIPP